MKILWNVRTRWLKRQLMSSYVTSWHLKPRCNAHVLERFWSGGPTEEEGTRRQYKNPGGPKTQNAIEQTIQSKSGRRIGTSSITADKTKTAWQGEGADLKTGKQVRQINMENGIITGWKKQSAYDNNMKRTDSNINKWWGGRATWFSSHTEETLWLLKRTSHWSARVSRSQNCLCDSEVAGCGKCLWHPAKHTHTHRFERDKDGVDRRGRFFKSLFFYIKLNVCLSYEDTRVAVLQMTERYLFLMSLWVDAMFSDVVKQAADEITAASGPPPNLALYHEPARLAAPVCRVSITYLVLLK